MYKRVTFLSGQCCNATHLLVAVKQPHAAHIALYTKSHPRKSHVKLFVQTAQLSGWLLHNIHITRSAKTVWKVGTKSKMSLDIQYNCKLLQDQSRIEIVITPFSSASSALHRSLWVRYMQLHEIRPWINTYSGFKAGGWLMLD